MTTMENPVIHFVVDLTVTMGNLIFGNTEVVFRENSTWRIITPLPVRQGENIILQEINTKEVKEVLPETIVTFMMSQTNKIIIMTIDEANKLPSLETINV